MIDDANSCRKKPLGGPMQHSKKVIKVQYQSTMGCRPRLSSLKTLSFNIMYTNADQLTPSKKTKLQKKIESHKPLIVAVCEVESTKSKRVIFVGLRNSQLYAASIKPRQEHWHIAFYSLVSIRPLVVQMNPEITFEEVSMLEVILRGGESPERARLKKRYWRQTIWT